ncbi:MAG: hypothetical protein HRT44_11725, partial [Bdellovibrionales bacterium]|nr:hypothetical protein [Bdellovibrionales bacterium]NQZ19908.1 hypothetical protein [Bdellovibrionales bacterium]
GRASYMAIDSSGDILVHNDAHSGANETATISVLDPSTETHTILYGQEPLISSGSSPTDLCDGVLGTTCLLDGTISPNAVITEYKYETLADLWLIARYGRNYVNTLSSADGQTDRFEVTNNNIRAFDFSRASGQYLYYCATNGRLYKRDVVADTEVELTLPSISMSCVGQSVHYHSGRDSLIFILQLNGLNAIAEYKNP